MEHIRNFDITPGLKLVIFLYRYTFSDLICKLFPFTEKIKIKCFEMSSAEFFSAYGWSGGFSPGSPVFAHL